MQHSVAQLQQRCHQVVFQNPCMWYLRPSRSNQLLLQQQHQNWWFQAFYEYNLHLVLRHIWRHQLSNRYTIQHLQNHHRHHFSTIIFNRSSSTNRNIVVQMAGYTRHRARMSVAVPSNHHRLHRLSFEYHFVAQH